MAIQEGDHYGTKPNISNRKHKIFNLQIKCIIGIKHSNKIL